MKYIVVLGDGMSDFPLERLGGKTPLQYARIPAIDEMARHGTIGLARTVPRGMPPGSDTANLSVLGYDPRTYYSGRSPFEAASMGILLGDDDVSFRCNLITLSEGDSFDEKTMVDYSAGEITSKEAACLMTEVDRRLGSEVIRFYPGVSYRGLMVWNNAPYDWKLTPPHDISGRQVGPYLPVGESSPVIQKIMRESNRLLAGHPINLERVANGRNPANSVWIWGEGKKPKLSGFSEKYGLRGAVISAVDLVKGIGICAGLDAIRVEGATGNIHTNFAGKAMAAVDALCQGYDFVYIHVEAPDECSHQFETENKVRAIELIDEKVVRVVRDELADRGIEYRMMVLPDHATPLSLGTHTDDPVPFLIYQSTARLDFPGQAYDEVSAAGAGLFFEEGHTLMDFFLRRRITP